MVEKAGWAFALRKPPEAEEEERLAFPGDDFRYPNRAAGGRAKLFALERRNRARRIEEVLRVEIRVTQKLEQRSMKLIGAATGRHIHLAQSAPIFGGVSAALDFEFLQRVDRW